MNKTAFAKGKDPIGFVILPILPTLPILPILTAMHDSDSRPSLCNSHQQQAMPTPCRIFAHRGANRIFPENTLTAFQAAFRLGATHLECDLTLSKDQELLIFHDDTLLRMTGHDSRRVDELLEQELTDILLHPGVGSAGNIEWVAPKPHDQRESHERHESHESAQRIPTLENLLAMIHFWQKQYPDNQAIFLNLEIKKSCYRNESVAQTVVGKIHSQLANSHLQMQNILISSFDWRFLLLAKKFLPETPQGIID